MKKKNQLLKAGVETPAIVLEKIVHSGAGALKSLAKKKSVKKARSFWRTLGPGFTTGASDDDPAGIATYSQTGAQYGFQLLWLSGFTLPLMAFVQEMCARIGLVTGRGLAANIRAYFPRWVLGVTVGLLFVANTLNVGANLGAMAEATQLLFPEINFIVLVCAFALIILFLQIFVSYARYARILKYLAMVLLAYIFSTLLISDLDWGAVFFSTIIPSMDFSREQFFLICAILGTTLSPYLFFWQTSQEVEEEVRLGRKSLAKRIGAKKDEVKNMRIDVWSGMFFSNIVMFFIITASGAALHLNGITDIETAAEAAEALRPFAGDLSAFLFALGIIGTGFLAIPVLAGSAAYAVADACNWKNGLHYKLKSAYAFYGVLIISVVLGLLMNFFGFEPMKALIYSAFANGLVSPVILVLIVLISSRAQIMGKWKNRFVQEVIGWFTVAVMALVGCVVLLSFVP